MSADMSVPEKAERPQGKPTQGGSGTLPPPPQTTEPVKTDAPPRKPDTELRIMGRMARILDEVGEPVRARIVTWLSSRYTETPK
jgi:hypothetical protein